MLKIQGLQVHYGLLCAVRDASLEIKQGEIVVIIGPNGAGKTTILKTIAGLLKPTNGTIELFGERITPNEPADMVERGVTLVPEGRQIFPYFTVLENLRVGAYGRIAKGVNKSEIAQDLEQVLDLFPVLRERIGQSGWSLSGGEQQMLAIGRGLMAKPSIMLLDEPSLGLAPKIVSDMFDVIQKISDTGTTILLVEQNANAALRLADRAYVMETGEIIAGGMASDIRSDPKIQEAYLGKRS
ncbi:MAG TPA: ABC transporter ATP-binding protein [Bacillota bacterium]|jgi:branched-chain amino acid transport system ATP-binding protein|nr:ABC transporter ATP-binding protein [Bacillota bacterium]